MKIEDGVAIESDVGGVLDEELDGVLVIQDHLGFELISSFRLLTELNEPLRVEESRYCLRGGLSSRRDR